MTVAYAMTDLAPSRDGTTPPGAVSVSPAHGGCGVCHEITLSDDGRPVITCPVCAPVLVGGHYGWSATPGAVPLTPDENAARELAKRDAEAGQNQLLTAVVADFLERNAPAGRRQAAAPAEAPSLADALKGVSADELIAALPPGLADALAAAATGAHDVPKAKAPAVKGTRARPAR